MKRKNSAGILLFRRSNKILEVLLVHPGGPFWARKDDGSWSIPKGELDENEDRLKCAIREFEEETGGQLRGEFIELHPLKQKSGKIIYAWATEGDFDPSEFKSNFFEMEWPPRSGKMKEFPEADKVQWFSIAEANKKLLAGQAPFLSQLQGLLDLK